MSRRAAALLLGAALGVLLVALVVLWRPARTGETPTAEVSSTEPPTPAAPEVANWRVQLFFATREGLLEAEERLLPAAASPPAAVARLAAALFEGPREPGHVALWPASVRCRRALFGADGVAYLDLAGAEGEEPPGWGSESETLAVFGLVNTLTENLPQVRQVVLLWNGSQRASLAGHLDTARPLAANRQLFLSPP